MNDFEGYKVYESNPPTIDIRGKRISIRLNSVKKGGRHKSLLSYLLEIISTNRQLLTIVLRAPIFQLG